MPEAASAFSGGVANGGGLGREVIAGAAVSRKKEA